MSVDKIRHRIAHEAARLMYERQESEYFRAKVKAAKRLGHGWVKPSDLPSNREVRDEIQVFARLFEREGRLDNLRDMRVAAVAMMRRLRAFRPHLIGSVLTGHVRQGSDIDLHLFADHVDAVVAALEQDGLDGDVERKRVLKQGEERVFTHVHVVDRFRFELTIYPANKVNFPFLSSITGKRIERASLAELEALLAREYPALEVEQAVLSAEQQIDRFQLYRILLIPLESVKQNPQYHPEGDALYHSLQVFDLACAEQPYDEEFLLAALLHDVGKAIDPRDHVRAGLEALEDLISDRTHWLIEHHMEGHALRAGTLGSRAVARLRESEHFDDLILLSQCDRRGRLKGIETSELDEALEYLRELADENG